MKHADQSQARRRLLRLLVAGGGIATVTRVLPGSWTRPVVESVIVPAHAQLSFNGTGNNATTNNVVFQSNPVLDLLVPRAVAVVESPTLIGYSVCFQTVNYVSTVQVYLSFSDESCARYSGNISNVTSFTSVSLTHDGGPDSISVNISGAVSGVNIVGSVVAGTDNFNYVATPGDCSPVCEFLNIR